MERAGRRARVMAVPRGKRTGCRAGPFLAALRCSTRATMSLDLYATIGVGLETVVSRELAGLGITAARVEPGRVRFGGTADDMYRALLHLRCASRVVRELAFETIEHEADIYDVVRELDWSAHFDPSATFRVTFNAHSSLVHNSRFWTYRVKDAVCDAFVERRGRRPDVDVAHADVHVYCYLENRRLSVGLDAAGDPLHMRGYRVGQHVASLREHLAAAMVLQSGWEPSRPLHDPFCGSGTILIEAAMIATHTPPSAWRSRFACEHWIGFDAARLGELRAEALAKVVAPPELRVSGADADPAAVSLARENLASAGFGGAVRVDQCNARDMEPVLDGVVIANPPYGERLDASDKQELYAAFRQRLLACKGSRVVLLQGDPAFEKLLSLRPAKRNRMNNGSIECVLYQYDIRA